MGVNTGLRAHTSLTLVLRALSRVCMQVGQPLTYLFEQCYLIFGEGLGFERGQRQCSQPCARIALCEERGTLGVHPGGEAGERGEVIIGGGAGQSELFV